MSDRRAISKPFDVAHIRENPVMYLGGVKFFGFVQYLVSAFDLMLAHGATWIEFEPGASFRLSSDAIIPTHLDRDGLLEPFEAVGELPERHLPDATVLMALSQQLRATLRLDGTETVLVTRRGLRESLERTDTPAVGSGTTLEFTADTSIFTVVDISPTVARSYCKRMSCLHPKVTFRLSSGAETAEYRSPDGIRELFDAVTTPYQILHEPIHLQETKGDLTVEAVLAFHSWHEMRIWSFANKGRVPDGGTHEAGFREAVTVFRPHQSKTPVGVVAVVAVEYPGIAFEGCIKAKIATPELRTLVRDVVSTGLERWTRENEAEFARIQRIEPFQFGTIW